MLYRTHTYATHSKHPVTATVHIEKGVKIPLQCVSLVMILQSLNEEQQWK